MRFVIPGLTRNPVSFWIPAFAGMTGVVVTNDVVYKSCLDCNMEEEVVKHRIKDVSRELRVGSCKR